MFNKKMFLTIAILVPMCIYSDLSTSQIDGMVSKIKAKRVRVRVDKNDSFISPFIVLRKEDNSSKMKIKKLKQKDKDAVFTLDAIINAKAYVNKRWLALGDMTNGYKVVSLDTHSIKLKKGRHEVELFIPKLISKNKKPIFTLQGEK